MLKNREIQSCFWFLFLLALCCSVSSTVSPRRPRQREEGRQELLTATSYGTSLAIMKSWFHSSSRRLSGKELMGLLLRSQKLVAPVSPCTEESCRLCEDLTQESTQQVEGGNEEHQRRAQRNAALKPRLFQEAEERSVQKKKCQELQAPDAAVSFTSSGSRLAEALKMASRSLVALLAALCACRLGVRAAGRSKVNPRIITAPQGAREYAFPRSEKYPVFYHEENTSAIYVGGEGRLYYHDFATSENYVEDFPVENGGQCLKPGSPEDNKNFITLVAKHGDGMLVCGTGACAPTCWNLTQRQKGSPQDGRGLAPFTPDANSLVVVDYPDIYSTIKKSQQNGKIPRFRRVRGGGELYTSDTVMQNPQFVKATTLKHEESHQDKIYYFFREDNPDKSLEAPRNISRVAQLCKEDKGGTSSLSASKWTTFLKASLICVDPATKGNFNWLQDVFFVPASNWRESKVYGLFTNTWGSSAVCVYSFGDIDDVFRTSKLKGYNGPNPEIKPGQCVSSGQHTPSETFKIADSHPEVEDRVEPLAPSRSPLFHNKHRYQKIGVHKVSVREGQQYTVLYLATDKGSIHKVVELPEGVQNIMEIQVFSRKEPIQSMILDHERGGAPEPGPEPVARKVPEGQSYGRHLPEHHRRPFLPLLPQLPRGVPLRHLQLVPQRHPHQDLQQHPPAAGLLLLHPERQPRSLRPLPLRVGGGRLQAGAGEGAPGEPAPLHVPEGPCHHHAGLLAAAAPGGAAGGAPALSGTGKCSHLPGAAAALPALPVLVPFS
uniref:Semaphorin 7A (JohnMiltonHagen blood group) n=1 Tax=Anas platyrhynchos platyrhynchos TaxID=8840 RepID=U3IUK9_ANAPP